MKMRALIFIGFSLGAIWAATPALAQGDVLGTVLQNGMMPNSAGGVNGMMGMMQGVVPKNAPQVAPQSAPQGMGAQDLPVTVTAVNPSTGELEGRAGEAALKLYFPPSTLAQVKVGDRLSVHMSFTR